jgi:hypothetical protein
MPRPKLPPGKRRTKWLKIRVNSAEAAKFKKRVGGMVSTRLRNRAIGGGKK